MLLLALSLVFLLAGPLLYRAVRGGSAGLAALDGFILVAIGGIVLLHVMPESLEAAGWPAAAALLAGLFLPVIFERSLHGVAQRTHQITLVLALAGIALHALLDGLAIGTSEEAGSHALPLAVILHRLPISVAIWWLLRPSYGRRLAIVVLSTIAAATVAGFGLGGELLGGLHGSSIALFQALVAGSLLHVIAHAGHAHIASLAGPRGNFFAGLGALIAIALLYGMSASGHGSPETGRAGAIFLELALQSAPALLLGYLTAGLLHAFLPAASVRWMGKGGSFGQSLRGVSFGLPLPICSCGVLPVYHSLILRGVPAAAAMAFLVATPELGIGAVLLSIPLLGAPMTVARVVCAACVALVIGIAVGRRTALHEVPPVNSCCSGEEASAASRPGFAQRLRAGLSSGLSETVDSTGPWILLGIGVAALLDPLLREGWLGAVPAALQVPFFALLGMPTYVCATGATPLVAMLIFKGVSPGAALAFLLTGPATNVTTFGILSRLHGRAVALRFALGIAALAIALGYAVNAALPGYQVPILAHGGAHEHSWLALASLSALAAAFALSIFRQGPRHFIGQILAPHEHGEDDGCRDGGGGAPPEDSAGGSCCSHS